MDLWAVLEKDGGVAWCLVLKGYLKGQKDPRKIAEVFQTVWLGG